MAPEREIITIGVGGAGVNIAGSFINQINAEHGVGADGTGGEAPNSFYVTKGGKNIVRSVLVDTDHSSLEEMRTSSLSNVLDPEFLVEGKEDCFKNFAAGHYTNGKDVIDLVNDRVRKLVDGCDNFQGFNIVRSSGGGTGSGLGALIEERLAVDYRRQMQFLFEVQPGDARGCVEPCEVYNATFASHWNLDHAQCTVGFQNKRVAELTGGPSSSLSTLNAFIAQTMSAVLAPCRYRSKTLEMIKDDMVTFPRLSYLTASLCHGSAGDKMFYQSLLPNNFSYDPNGFSKHEDKYMGMHFYSFGGISANHQKLGQMARSGEFTFVEWMPSGHDTTDFESGIAGLDGDAVLMLGNNTCANRYFGESLSKKFDVLYSQRAYVHLYVGEGMEEGEFKEAREDLGFLSKDYVDVVSEVVEDDDEEEEYR